MQKNRYFFVVYFLIAFMVTSCNSQTPQQQNLPEKMDTNKLVHRKPAVAGQFYPADAKELTAELEDYYFQAVPVKTNNVAAIISPHAGYVFSGGVAASAFNQVDPEKEYKHVFILASSHRVGFKGASIYNKGHYITPLGTAEVDLELANKLITENACFTHYPEAHTTEHSLEVQLPFLQHRFRGKNYKIIPVVMGTQNPEMCKNIARALKPFFGGDNLFIISTDFSHFPKYDDAVNVDQTTADAIITNDPQQLLNTLKENDAKMIHNLSTSLCGWTSVLTLLYVTHDLPDVTYTQIQYKNSGDTEYGEKGRVVGYYGITVSKTGDAGTENFSLSEKDKETLLNIAKSTVHTYVKTGNIPEVSTDEFPNELLMQCGAFVSLYKNGELRGCIGRFNPEIPLWQVVQDMAISSATEDTRFQPVRPDELEDISIEISVLSPMKKISSIDEIELGKHGIYIKKGLFSGTFLPQVATEQGWSKEEFLGYCSKHKAGLGWDGWKKADVYTYTAIVFGSKK